MLWILCDGFRFLCFGNIFVWFGEFVPSRVTISDKSSGATCCLFWVWLPGNFPVFLCKTHLLLHVWGKNDVQTVLVIHQSIKVCWIPEYQTNPTAMFFALISVLNVQSGFAFLCYPSSFTRRCLYMQLYNLNHFEWENCWKYESVHICIFLKEMYYFICIKLIKSDIYNVDERFSLNRWFLKDHVTLKTGLC